MNILGTNMEINAIPVNVVMDMKELANKMADGWRVMCVMPVATGSGVATPDNPQGATVTPCVIWYRQRGMIPAGVVAGAIINLANRIQEFPTTLSAINQLSLDMFGMPVPDLASAIQQQEENSGKEEK